MKKILVGSIAALAVVLSGCGTSPCDTLKTQCDACANATAKAVCTATVATANLANSILGGSGDNACKAAVDAKTYEASSTACKAAASAQ